MGEGMREVTARGTELFPLSLPVPLLGPNRSQILNENWASFRKDVASAGRGSEAFAKATLPQEDGFHVCTPQRHRGLRELGRSRAHQHPQPRRRSHTGGSKPRRLPPGSAHIPTRSRQNQAEIS